MSKALTKEEKRSWRWWINEPTKLTKLQEAYTADASDEQAMVYAGITRSQLYYYQKLHPEFSDWKKLLKNDPLVKAKANIIKAIQDGKVAESQWYLERKAKDEFSPRHENVNLNMNADVSISDEEKAKIQAVLLQNAHPQPGSQ